MSSDTSQNRVKALKRKRRSMLQGGNSALILLTYYVRFCEEVHIFISEQRS